MEEIKKWVDSHKADVISAKLTRNSIIFTAEKDSSFNGTAEVTINNKQEGRHLLYLLGFKKGTIPNYWGKSV